MFRIFLTTHLISELILRLLCGGGGNYIFGNVQDTTHHQFGNVALRLKSPSTSFQFNVHVSSHYPLSVREHLVPHHSYYRQILRLFYTRRNANRKGNRKSFLPGIGLASYLVIISFFSFPLRNAYSVPFPSQTFYILFITVIMHIYLAHSVSGKVILICSISYLPNYSIYYYLFLGM